MSGTDAILARLMGLHPKIIDLTLDRVWRLLDALGNPQDALPPVVHIAGTNGKGSTLAMIRAGLEAGGHRVHAYTSPHLARFHERIRLAGRLIDEDHLVAVLDECEAANGGAPITYFEITTCAALLAMTRCEADFTLLEVGLGGRLDATNVIEAPRLCVITPVSLDHQSFLGDTLAEIAVEKAGILKRRTPCIVSRQPDEAMDAIEAGAAALDAPLLAQGQHWHVRAERERLIFQDETGLADLPLPGLAGPHQIDNAGTALAALRHIQREQAETAVTDTDIGTRREAMLDAAVTRARWPARMQRLTSGPLPEAAPDAQVFLDGGHNPAAGEALAATLAGLPLRETHLICGMLNTKDVAGYLRPLAAAAHSLTAVSIPGEANTLPAEATAGIGREVGLPSGTAPDALAAIRAIAARAPRARILICGSLYLAGHILRSNA